MAKALGVLERLFQVATSKKTLREIMIIKNDKKAERSLITVHTSISWISIMNNRKINPPTNTKPKMSQINKSPLAVKNIFSTHLLLRIPILYLRPYSNGTIAE
ncbi:hypothetical protein [Sporosarcina sp. A2]|uniref:hypothetical protein n=1 Tax=Sporosarcina sp. A2 TaxID=3393449 RepID=UPI003D790E91